jgi:hypothetical protein
MTTRSRPIAQSQSESSQREATPPLVEKEKEKKEQEPKKKRKRVDSNGNELVTSNPGHKHAKYALYIFTDTNVRGEKIKSFYVKEAKFLTDLEKAVMQHNLLGTARTAHPNTTIVEDEIRRQHSGWSFKKAEEVQLKLYLGIQHDDYDESDDDDDIEVTSNKK